VNRGDMSGASMADLHQAIDRHSESGQRICEIIGPSNHGCQIGKLLEVAGKMRGGEHRLYNPGLRARARCEHDECAAVAFFRPCKSCPVMSVEPCEITTPIMYGIHPIRRALLAAILLMLQSGAEYQ